MKFNINQIVSKLKLNLRNLGLLLQRRSLEAWRIFCSWPVKKRVIVAVSVLAALIVLLIVVNLIEDYAEKEALLKAENAPVPVITTSANMTTVPQSLTGVGNMQAILSVPVSFDADGVLANLYVKDGQQVKKGQLIAALDTHADMAQLQYYQANYALQEANYRRMLSIRNTGAISEQMLDGQKASVIQAQSQVNQQQAIIQQKYFYAPFDGALSNFNASIGGYLAKGTAIASLVQEAPLYVQYALPVSDRPLVELGQSVTVTTAAYPGQQFKGILSYVAPQANTDSGTMTLQATIDNPDFLLLPGMFVSVSQMVNPNRQLLTIPDVAVMSDIIGQYVFKVLPDNKVRKVYLTTGESLGNLVPVFSGLQAGNVIVIAGQQKLNDGSYITTLNDPELVRQIRADATKGSNTNANPSSSSNVQAVSP